jgi:hypothetical protein
MGKVFRPEDLNSSKPQGIPDITTRPIPAHPTRREIEVLRREVESIREEIEKIKAALGRRGITIE